MRMQMRKGQSILFYENCFEGQISSQLVYKHHQVSPWQISKCQNKKWPKTHLMKCALKNTPKLIRAFCSIQQQQRQSQLGSMIFRIIFKSIPAGDYCIRIDTTPPGSFNISPRARKYWVHCFQFGFSRGLVPESDMAYS